jgi:hypothetical protein
MNGEVRLEDFEPMWSLLAKGVATGSPKERKEWFDEMAAALDALPEDFGSMIALVTEEGPIEPRLLTKEILAQGVQVLKDRLLPSESPSD